MPDGRNIIITPSSPQTTKSKSTSILVSLLALALTAFAFVAVSPAHAEPSIKSVKEKVDKLYHEAEIASERYNTAKVRIDKSRDQLAALSGDLDGQQDKVDGMRRDVAALVVAQYQGQALSTASELALADDPDAFLDNLNAVTAYNAQRAEVLDSYGEQLERLELRKSAVKKETKSLATAAKKLAADKKIIDDKAAEAKAELDKLEDAAFERMMAGDFSGELPSVSASGRAGAVVKFALSQVGKSYVYGAAGPSAYDCSGLTMVAWSRAGVGLPHSSSAQQGSGRRVSQGDLQPGDLVFYYSPVSHVGIYIGGGRIVHAANPGAGVKIDSVNSMPYSGAVRPG